MQKSLLISSLCILPFLVGCESTRGVQTSDTAEMQASTEEVEVALDPNDPNVMVCPVTGAMELIDNDESGGHGDMDEHGEGDM